MNIDKNELNAELNKNINEIESDLIEEVDCSGDDNKHKGRYGVKEMMHKYKVEGYPTIILVKDGDHYLYDTKPDADRIEEFVDTYF